MRNGMEVTTVFLLHGSSRIRPVAENAEKAAEFGYVKNFEQYILNKIQLSVEKTVAAEPGYCDVYAFSKQFKQYEGIPPSNLCKIGTTYGAVYRAPYRLLRFFLAYWAGVRPVSFLKLRQK